MSDRLHRRLSRLIAVLLLGVGLVSTILYFQLRRSIQSYDDRLPLAGLEAGATVWFDEFAIPTLEAVTEADLYRVQGFVHASERLWQMELFQRIARGQLAEVFGDMALEADRLIRTLDLWGAAERGVAALAPEQRALLEAYAEGVNGRLESWEGPWPPEFIVLGIDPRPWSPHATIAIGKIMALDLSTWGTELDRILAAARLPAEKLAELETAYPPWGPTILQDGPARGRAGDSAFASASHAAHGTWLERLSGHRVPAAHRSLDSRAAPVGPTDAPSGPGWDPLEFLSGFAFTASNSWALSGTRTLDGHPLLASDMHLTLRAPATWYVNSLHAVRSGLHVAGLTIPGVPGVVVGYNRDLAWAFTNGMVDDADFALETVSPDGSAYGSGDGWVPFSVRRESIAVRGRVEPVVHEVRATSRGPVITDVIPVEGLTLSLLWTGREPRPELPGLLAMNRARTAEEFDASVQAFQSPHQNVIYATTRGELGYRLSGSVPRRVGFDGALPISADALAGAEWAGYWPADAMPSARDPASGFLASANNLQSSPSYGSVGVDYPLPFRARRIVDRLEAANDWTLNDMRDLQLDTYSLWARRLLPRAVDAARRAASDSIATELESWNGRVSVESSQATLFHVWLYMLRGAIAADEYGGDPDGWFPDGTLLRILETGDGAWVDDVRTPGRESLEDLEEEAMRAAIGHTAGRRWGEVHMERSRHLIGQVDWLNRLFGFHVGPYPGAGGPYTVRPDDPARWRSLDSSSWELPIVSEYGPSERFIAHLVPGRARGYFLLPTGQSGNPLSRHYRDMLDRWAEGRLIEVPLEPDSARAAAVSSLQLEPVGR
jgi:penicillin amidase